VIEWMNHQPLGTIEEDDHENNDTVSQYLVLHILALKFCIRDLAVEALCRYKSCRNPHWEGLWLPLASEISYIVDNDEHATQAKGVVVGHIMSQLFSYR
jgi:hypothetical protein